MHLQGTFVRNNCSVLEYLYLQDDIRMMNRKAWLIIMNERRIRNNRRRRQRELRKHILISVFTICITLALTFGIFSMQTTVRASSETPAFKYYTSIVVSCGDTLSALAEKYMDEHYDSASDYIHEVMKINALQNETIYAGQCLIIPYYSYEFKN